MGRGKVRGSFTIWFAMTISLVILMMTSLLAYCRSRLVWTAIRRDLDLSAQSLMGEYRQDWVKEYGLYMIPLSALEPGVRFYMEGNRDHPYGKVEIPDLDAEAVKTLADPDCLKEQITYFMKERGLLDLTQEILDMVTKSQNTKGLEEVKNMTRNTEGLLEVQQYYGQLVTDFYGIGSDGFTYPYAINQCLTKDPSYEEINNVYGKLVKGTPLSSEDAAVLERALSYVQETENLCQDAQTAAQNIKAAIRRILSEEGGEETASDLPIDEEGAEKVRKAAEHNQKICQKAGRTLEKTISWIGSDEDQATVEALDQEFFTIFTKYDYSVSLPYEYKEPSAGWDLTAILRTLQGFDEDIGALAPDEEKDMKLEGLGRDPEGKAASPDGSAEGLEGELYPVLPPYDDTGRPEERILLNEYCLGVFQNYRQTQDVHDGGKALNLRGDKIKGHFFQNEVEYLIVGSNNEFNNVNGTRLRLAAFRAALNMAYLVTDPEKRAEIESVSSAAGGILMPGIGNMAVYAALLAIWGWGEAISDYRQLSDGGTVPLWKTEKDWHTDLTSLLTDMTAPADQPSSSVGLSYRQYLRFLLLMMPEEKLLERIQDLLYVNHQYFPLSEAVTAFRITGTAGTDGAFKGLGTSGMGDLTFRADYGYD